MAAKSYNFKESNIANIGSEMDIQQRRAVAAKETAWRNAGKVPGIQIWRIEKFKVVPWPKDLYGSFFSGDSYIVLSTYKKKGSQALCWDIHFWLGRETTQDESGTAAYKTVELDDYLGGAPVQHRETQEHESDLFLSYFKNGIKIMEGGIDSGFKKVEAESYRPRLLQLKGKKRVRVTEVPMSRDSLNSGDVFILDAGLNVYQWVGRKSSGLERYKGAAVCRAIDDERRGLVTIHVFVEGQKDEDVKAFWDYLGGEGPIKTAEEGGSDAEAEKHDTKRLFRLSDASGTMEFTLVGEAGAVNRSMLDSNDVFILDTGAEVFAWIGKGSSPDEKRDALKYAQDYLTQYNRPSYIPISRILEGGENEIFEHALL